MSINLLEASCRFAFSALIHDIGKFLERAKTDKFSKEKIDSNKQTFCPFNSEKGYHTHAHSAFTGLAIDEIEHFLPSLVGENVFPFKPNTERDVDDSLICCAAKHHKADTYLQKIVQTADRLSSAFERDEYDNYNKTKDSDNYITARLFSLFEKMGKEKLTQDDFSYTYPLKAICPTTIFPQGKRASTKEEASKEYADLWNDFSENLQKIPSFYKSDWNLFIDAFDTLWGVYTQNIPSASYKKTIADVSLYDHSKSTAALATALWRYHYETKTETTEALKLDEENKFLLIQADLSGIQQFIFAQGGQTQKKAAKLLRGRSFFISLLSEALACLILKRLSLPSTSQVINAAGKLLIVAPNTIETKDKINSIQQEVNQWFLDNLYGISSMNIVSLPACQKDFQENNFKSLQEKLFKALETAKYQSFNLCSNNIHSVFEGFLDSFTDKKVCSIDGLFPATTQIKDSEAYCCDLCSDILKIGEFLTKRTHITLSLDKDDNCLKTNFFGFYISFSKRKENTFRTWDFSLASETDLFNGYSRRYINAYVPKFKEFDSENPIYRCKKINENIETDEIKTFAHIACEDCIYEADKETLKGKSALISIKGDIDNLGALLESFNKPTFATMAGISRQINAFFALWLPYICQTKTEAKNIYTVFAGGDDFFLIGPWLSQTRFIKTIKEAFEQYVCNDKSISFSTGLLITKPDMPIRMIASQSELALEHAKAFPDKEKPTKNAITCFGRTVSYETYFEMQNKAEELETLREKYKLSTGYIYRLIYLCEKAERAKEHFEESIWASQFAYRTVRHLSEKLKLEDSEQKEALSELSLKIGNNIRNYTEDYKIALFTYLYQQRQD